MSHKKMKKIAAATYAVFILPFFTVAKNDSFVNYHFKQSTTLIVLTLAARGLLALLIYWGLGRGASVFLAFIIWACFSVGVIYGAVNSLAGNKKPLPIIGKYAEKL